MREPFCHGQIEYNENSPVPGAGSEAVCHELYPQLEIQNMGESEFIVEYDTSVQKSEILEIVKVTVLCVLIFIGSAFSIMVFNNDVGVDDVFARTYELLTGQPSSGYTVMELMYSVGIAVGVIVFYNHFGKKRFTDCIYGYSRLCRGEPACLG